MDDKTIMTDDQLLKRFFSDAAQQTIDDNGFSERVMQHLPAMQESGYVQRFARLWTAFCILVFVVLFVVFHGWELLAVHFEVMYRTIAAESFTINPLMLAAVLFGLLFVGVGEVISSEIVRR